MASYEDIQGDAEAMMYMKKYRDGDRAQLSGFKLWNMTFKAAPRKGVSITQNMCSEIKMDDNGDAATKSSAKVDVKHGDYLHEITAKNDTYGLKVSGPVVGGDWEVDGSLNWEDKVGKERKLVAGLEISSPDMSGAVMKKNVEVEHKMFPAKDAETKVKVDVGVLYEKNMMFGAEVEHAGGETSMSFGGAYKDGGNKYWFGYDHSNQFARVGAYWPNELENIGKVTQGFEARWNMDDKAKDQKFMGQDMPLTIAAGKKWPISDKTTWTSMVELGASWHAQCKLVHKVDKNWTVATHQSFNAGSAKRAPYQIGFDVAYQL